MSSPETFTFALPNPSKHISDPLPLGCLVSASASSTDPGLVVVVPTTGRITYWESISSAATLDLRLQRTGVELTIPGLLSGESVIQILNAESAGFILGFSTGRIAYMGVRDGQGRPTISVQFLRGTGGTGSGGLFGSLRNALSASAWRGDIAAIRAGRPDKIGERDVVVATAKGKIQAWNIHRGGHTSLVSEADGREAIVMAIKKTVPSLADLHLESFELLDFAYTPKSLAGSQLNNNEDDGVHLLLLTSLKARDISHYSLVEVILKSNGLDIGTIRPIKSYTTPISRNSKARLYLPNPALVSYIVFDRAVVVISMAKQQESPENQLRLESHLTPKTFEDVIDFREEINVEIVGSGMEEPSAQIQGNEEMKARRHRPKHPAAVLFVRGGGIVRVAATDTPRLLSNRPQQVTARSKLEQAVFFGTLEQNPLSFSVRSELQFPASEIGAAALSLSLDILKSCIPYIPSVPASIDQNLRKRSKALSDLAKYIKASGIKLDRATKWKLLADAEKMAAATAIWRQYDTGLREKPAGKKRGLLTELVEFIHEDYKTEAVAEAGELDRVRHWFINDIWNLEIAVPWAYQIIKYTYMDGQKDHAAVFEIVSEANDMVIGSLLGAFDFRDANLELYGLGDEEMEHGILKSGYEGLPNFWTSTQFVAENARKQCELDGLLVKEYWDQPLGGVGQPIPSVVDKVRREHPVLIDVSIRSNNERIRWAAAQELPQSQIQAEQLRQVQAAAEDDQLSLLVTDLNLSDEAINLAEKHEILPTLAQITLHEISSITKEIAAAAAEGEIDITWTRRAVELRNRVREFFEKFGSRWASAFYEHLINSGSMSELFDEYAEQQEYLTAFLRSQPEYAKLAWIQEVTREKNFDAAAKSLLDLGLQRESDLWSQKVELGIGKLARLAGRDYSESGGIIVPHGQKIDVIPTDNRLALIKIQDQIYDHVRPSIASAIDAPAEIQLALEIHGKRDLQTQHRFASFLEEGMSRLVKHEALDALTLIDLLTLMSEVGGDYEFPRIQFFLALQACRRGITKKDEQSLVQRIIWRRCMLEDKWDEINDTDLKDDSEVSDQLRNTVLYNTLKACLHESKLFPSHRFFWNALTCTRPFQRGIQHKASQPRGCAGCGYG